MQQTIEKLYEFKRFKRYKKLEKKYKMPIKTLLWIMRGWRSKREEIIKRREEYDMATFEGGLRK